MNVVLLSRINELKEELTNHPDVIELEKIEKELENNEEIMKLCYRKDSCLTKYEDAIRYFGENSEEAKSAQKLLYQAKLEMDNNEIIKKYNEQFKKVRKLYDKINEEIFNKFN